MRNTNSRINLSDVLSNKNVAGEPYRSDVSRWIGSSWNSLGFKGKEELINKIKELQNG